MLVLSRYVGEAIDIDGGISITVVEIRGDKVRLGISAPRDVAVHRREVTERIDAERNGVSGRILATDSATQHSDASDS